MHNFEIVRASRADKSHTKPMRLGASERYNKIKSIQCWLSSIFRVPRSNRCKVIVSLPVSRNKKEFE